MSYPYYPYQQGNGQMNDWRPVNPYQQAGHGVPQSMAQSQQAPGAGYAPQTHDLAAPGQLPIEQSYIENILRLNKGKVATVYMTFENNDKWNAKIFKGVIEAAGRDHIILSDPQTGKRYLLLMVYVNYITFDEEINYSYPYDGQHASTGHGAGPGTSTGHGMSTYTPR